MNLRQARFDDHWRRVFARTYPTRLSEISFTHLQCLSDSKLEFSGGITAVIGSNGVGKSTLVAAIADLLANGSEVAPGHHERLRGSTLEGSVFQEGAELQLRVADDGEAGRKGTGATFEGGFRWLDPSYLANVFVNLIHADQNFADLLEPITPLQLDAEELDLVSYLVNRKYDDLAIYEIADYEDLGVFPYFRVSSGGDVYGSEGMGRGELSLLLSYWALKNTPRNSILILEEPETHVSPRSQDCLMNIVAKFSDEMGIWCILSTHSPTIIQRIPRRHIKLLTRHRSTSTVVNNPRYVEVATILGGGVAFRGALLVEDEEAKGFVLSILEEVDPDLLHQFEVVSTGSEAEITAALGAMPRTQDWLTLVGAYDGDQRSKEKQEVRWPITCLPGDLPPGHLLKLMLEETADINRKVATELRKTEELVGLALGHVAGVDHHDLVREFAAALNSTVSMVRGGLVRVWLAEGTNGGQAKRFIQDLRDAIESMRRG
jgi:predicted ATPase